MTDGNSFKKISSLSAKSFNDQKAMIKKVLSGREMHCKTCKGILKFSLPAEAEQNGTDINEPSRGSIYCEKGCTDLALDFAR